MNHRTPFGAASRVAALVSILALVPLAGPVEGSPGAVPADPIAALAAVQPPQVRTRVLVLGTFHLREIAEEFKPSMLDRLLPVLQGFRPDAICVETLSGTRVRELELRRDAGPLVGQVVDDFAAAHVKLGKRACEVLGTSPEKAAVRVREMFAATRAAGAGKRSPEERAALALWMLAAYDPENGKEIWHLSGKTVVAAYAIAARVARALGLETLEPVDDFEDLDAYAVIDAQLDKDLEGNALVAAISKTPVYQDAASRLKECVKSGDLLPQLALVNSAGYAAADVDAQWGVFLRTHFASGADRGRLGLWENRNLKIAARIRAVAALHPGGRVLVVYGAAHRPFLEAYLARTADVEVVGFENLAPQAPAAGAGAR